MAEVEALVFQRAKLWRQVRESIVIKIGALQTFAVDIDQVESGIVDLLRGFFVIGRKVRVAIARLGFYQLGNLMECGAGIHGGQRQAQRQQAVAMMMRTVTATAQNPGQRGEDAHQGDHQPQTRKDILTYTSAGQAVGQRVEHRVVNTVAGKIIAGI
ncbi:Uncharacterised protein [Klebsiella pneumoniae]|nr:Uncharacterised protein [Klebsiella pneumoniae]